MVNQTKIKRHTWEVVGVSVPYDIAAATGACDDWISIIYFEKTCIVRKLDTKHC